jgi:hypothetical protein
MNTNTEFKELEKECILYIWEKEAECVKNMEYGRFILLYVLNDLSTKD